MLGSSSGYHSYSLYSIHIVDAHSFLTHRLLGLSTNGTSKLPGKGNHSYFFVTWFKKNHDFFPKLNKNEKKKLFKIEEWLPFPMIYDESNIYYNYTMKKIHSRTFVQ